MQPIKKISTELGPLLCTMIGMTIEQKISPSHNLIKELIKYINLQKALIGKNKTKMELLSNQVLI